MTIKGLQRRIACFFVNNIFQGTMPNFWSIKRNLLNWAGIEIGSGSKIVGPVHITGDLKVGENTWIGTGFTVHGNGSVTIGCNCDIGPDATFLTGSHELGSHERRAGKGLSFQIIINDGVWIGGRSTFVGDIEIGKGCIVGACSLVNKSYSDDVIVAGIPSKIVKKFSGNQNIFKEI
ncbi:MAG: transferase [Acidaminococcaceae bacterium]